MAIDMFEKRKLRLGMNPSTARHKLVTDLLYDLVVAAGYTCYRCGHPLTRETFSLDHKVAWLNSDDPVKTFFDKSNVAYSHRSCNSRYTEKLGTTKYPEYAGHPRGAAKVALDAARIYSPARRHAQYERTGK